MNKRVRKRNEALHRKETKNDFLHNERFSFLLEIFMLVHTEENFARTKLNVKVLDYLSKVKNYLKKKSLKKNDK